MSKQFAVGMKVRVKLVNPGGTHRTPEYIKGKEGVILKSHGVVPGYEIDHREDWGPLYTVEFDRMQILDLKGNDKILVDVHEDWLELNEERNQTRNSSSART
jgi:Nitrile hydratase beta subunit